MVTKNRCQFTCTTSIPLATLPNTVCLLSNHGVATVVIKNWEPFVFWPAFAIDTVKGLSCLKLQQKKKNHLLLVPSEAKPYQEVSTCHRHIPQLIISLECEIMIFLAYSNRTFVDKLHYLLWNSSSNSLPQIDCPPVPSPKGSPVCIMKPLMTLWKIRLS